MKDLNKLDFEVSDVRDFRNIVDHLERLAKGCKQILWESMVGQWESVVAFYCYFEMALNVVYDPDQQSRFSSNHNTRIYTMVYLAC